MNRDRKRDLFLHPTRRQGQRITEAVILLWLSAGHWIKLEINEENK